MSLRASLGLVVALLAGGALLFGGDPPEPATPVAPGRVTAAQAWPQAKRADLPDLTVSPLLFLDVTTAVGTRKSADGKTLRLVIESPGGRERELRALPAAADPVFDNLTAAGDLLLWTESATGRGQQIWGADLRAGAAPRMITADIGNAVFYGNQFDLVVAEERVHWVATPDDADRITEVRSAPLTGGRAEVREVPGQWALSAWPWLTDDAGAASGTGRLRDLRSGREIRIANTGPEWNICRPTWCRVMVMADGGLARIDVMRPDGSQRRRIAGGGAQTAVADVAVLDRFEILAEPGPATDITGVAGLLAYDIATGRTVTLSEGADAAFTRDGMLWWSTGERDVLVWHTLDLRTV